MKKTEVDVYTYHKKEIRGFDYRFRRKHEWNGSSAVCGMGYPLSVERAIHCLDTPILDKDGKMTDQSLALANEITAKIEA